ncbi:uncharacterized protein LOC142241567 isoform X2 [Haematobia irritans]|uniref:uncharacterized protein LOC142241567 isoform X2 n=1 Tax=Haematobia irritans TaxID=7368 RepID=UPI003F4F609A
MDNKSNYLHIRTDHPEVEIVNSPANEIKSRTEKFDKATEMSNRSKGLEHNEHQSKATTNPKPKKRYEIETNRDKNSNEILERDPLYIPEEELLKLKKDIMKENPDSGNSEHHPRRETKSKVLYKHRYKLRTPSTTTTSAASSSPKPRRKRHLYRISIQKWSPANSCIYCPKCCCHGKPMIEIRTERIIQNQWCVSCLLNCWPCLIPWLLRGYEVQHLHCSNCQVFLGLYNPRSNCLKPNREFIAQQRLQLRPCSEKTFGRKDSSFLTKKISSLVALDNQKSNISRFPSTHAKGNDLPPAKQDNVDNAIEYDYQTKESNQDIKEDGNDTKGNVLKEKGEDFATKNNTNGLVTPIMKTDRPNEEVASLKKTDSVTVGKKLKSNRLPSITINGKKLHPDMVARLQSYSKYGRLAGLDLEEILMDVEEQGDVSPEKAAPPVVTKRNKKS